MSLVILVVTGSRHNTAGMDLARGVTRAYSVLALFAASFSVLAYPSFTPHATHAAFSYSFSS